MARKTEKQPAFLVGGNPVREALEKDDIQIDKILLQKGGTGSIHQIRKLATQKELPVQFVPLTRLNQLALGLNHQGVLATISGVKYLTFHDLMLEVASNLEDVRNSRPIILILDEIQDPRNFGAILLSAVAAGIKGVIVASRRMAPLNSGAIKSSAGTALRIPIARVDSLSAIIIPLKERGFWLVGADGEGETTVWDMDWKRATAIIIGNEEKGVHQKILEACDYRISIPIKGPVESLNASVAAGILMFAASKDLK